MTKADWNYAMKVRKEKGETAPERYGYSIEMGISLCDRCKKRADCKDFPDEKRVLTVAFCTEYVDEVVFCKDCKHYISGTCRRIIDGTERYCEVRKPSDYCSYGERRDTK